MSLMTVEPGVKPGFFVARFPVVPSINLAHSPRAGSYGESGGGLEFIPDSRSSLTRSQGQAPELSRFSRFSIPWNPPPGTGSVSWRAVGWNGSLLRREFSLLGRSITPAIWPIPQGRGNNREALPVNFLLVDSYTADSVRSSVRQLIRSVNNGVKEDSI